MTPSQTYRTYAAAQRKAALETNLLNRREMHERSAVAWESMAEAAEETDAKKEVNAAAKAAA